MVSFWDSLHIRNWNELSVEKREDVLNQLEKYYADLQGRNKCEIKRAEMPEKVFVEFIYPNFVFINEKLLTENKCYDAVLTILHEGRHAYQRHAAEKQIQQEVDWEKWSRNFDAYYFRSPYYYYFQPVEADAEKFAYEEMEKIYGELEKNGEKISVIQNGNKK